MLAGGPQREIRMSFPIPGPKTKTPSWGGRQKIRTGWEEGKNQYQAQSLQKKKKKKKKKQKKKTQKPGIGKKTKINSWRYSPGKRGGNAQSLQGHERLGTINQKVTEAPMCCGSATIDTGQIEDSKRVIGEPSWLYSRLRQDRRA